MAEEIKDWLWNSAQAQKDMLKANGFSSLVNTYEEYGWETVRQEFSDDMLRQAKTMCYHDAWCSKLTDSEVEILKASPDGYGIYQSYQEGGIALVYQRYTNTAIDDTIRYMVMVFLSRHS